MVCSRTQSNLIGHPAPPDGGVRTAIMIDVVTEEMHGSD